MQTLKKLDSEEQTVIAVQIQNEAGYLSGTRRDFSVWGEAAFGAEAPELLLDWCESHPECALAQHRKQPRGSWTAVFGGDGAEYLTAYAIAEYIEQMRWRPSRSTLFSFIRMRGSRSAEALPGSIGPPAPVRRRIWIFIMPYANILTRLHRIFISRN